MSLMHFLATVRILITSWLEEWLLWLAAAALLALVVRDYSRVEPTYQALRYEWANIRTEPAVPPDVVLLTQWRDFVEMVRVDTTKPMGDAELHWMENITSLYPNTGFFQVLAMSLARAGKPERAAHWLATMCKVMAPSHCAMVKAAWLNQAVADPALAAVPWPK